MIKNNITRLLDGHHIAYTVFELPVEKLGAEETAIALNVPLELIYKSIVLLREKPGKPVLAVLPGTRQVNLKLVADAIGEKKVRLSTLAEAERLTGLQVGGISPLALLNKGFTILLDDSVTLHEQVHVSGGERGLNIKLPVSALVELTRAKVTRLT